MALDIVRAKLRPPRPHRQLLPRPRLDTLALAHPVLLLVADAGYGKTSLLYHLATSYARVVWYSLDERDRDPVVFAQHLLASSFSESELAAVDWPRVAMLDTEQCARWLVGRFLTIATQPVLLVLDDFHTVTGAPVIQRTAIRLLADRPAELHVAMGSRQPIGLPLARLRAQGVVGEIDGDALRFTSAEVRAVVGNVDADEVERIVSVTGGWPAAVQLLGDVLEQSGSEPRRADLLARSRSQIDAFLIEEVLARLQPTDVELLRQISVLDQVDGDTAAAISHHADAAGRLDRLARRHSFVTSVATEDGTPKFRLHQLIRDLLLQRLGEAERRARLAEAAAHLDRANQTVEAASIYQTLADQEHLAELLRHQGERLLGIGRARMLSNWFGSLQRARVSADAQLLALHAQVLAEMGQFRESTVDFELAIDKLLEGGNHSMAVEAMRRLAGLHERRGAYAAARATLDRAVALLKPDDVAQSARIQNQMATLLLWTGRPDAALELIREVIARCQALHDEQREAVALHNFGSILHTLGRLEEARTAFLEALGPKRRLELWASAALSLNSLGVIYQQMDRFAEAEAALNEALELAERAGSVFVSSYALSNLGDLERDRGAFERATGQYERSIKLKQAMGNPYALAYTWNSLATLRRLAGDLQEARELNGRALELRVEEAGPLERLLFREESGRIAVALGDLGTGRRELLEVAVELSRLGAQFHFSRCAWHAAVAAWRLDATIPAGLADVLSTIERMGYQALLSRLVAETPDFALAVWSEGRDTPGLLSLLVQHADRVLPQVAPLADRHADRAERLSGLLTRFPGNPPVLTLVELSRRPNADVSAAASAVIAGLKLGPAPPLRIQGFDGLRVVRRGREIGASAWRRQRARELLALLLLAGPTGRTRDELMVACWPDASPEAGVEQFHSHVHALRAALEPEATRGASRYIENEGRIYRLAWELVDGWDVGEFESALHLARQTEATGDLVSAGQHYAAAAARYRGPLFAGLDSETDWLFGARQGYIDMATEAHTRLAGFRQSAGDLPGAMAAWNAALELDPFREDAHRALMQLYAAQGRRDDALAQYRRCVAQLHQGLDAEPGPETRAVYRALLAS